MKEMNRREFLTLSGAAVVAFSLAGCGGGSSAPPAPPASESKELALFKAINEVYADWKEETGVKLIAVSIDQAQNINKLKPMVDEQGWEYEVLLDPNGDFKRALGVQLIPYVLIVDGNGKIAYKHNGYTDGAENELIEKVRELLSK